MRLISAVALGVITLAGARPALADQPAPLPPPQDDETLVPHVGFNIGGGLSIPFSDAGDHFQTGGAFQLGGTYYIMSRLGIQAEYLYSGYSIKSNLLDVNGVNGTHVMEYGDLNAIYRFPLPRPFGIYVLGGPGIYYRRVQVTEVTGTTVAPYCDPWLFYCYAAPVEVSQVLGSRSRTDFGLNAGLGLTVRLMGGPVSLYAEARYHYIFSGSIDTPAGSKKADGQYMPIIFGFRL
jgi:hypothetical protein